MSTCNPQELMDSAACFACLPEDVKQTLKLQLLCEILNAGGGGGGGGVTSAIAGNGILVDQATGAVTITNNGVIALLAGAGIAVDQSTGTVTIDNAGVTSIIAGAGISVDAATGDVTVTATATGTIGGSTGATDNALLRADGAGGVTLQNSAVIADDSGNVTGVGSLTCTAFVLDQAVYSGRTLNRLQSDGTNESIVLGPSGTGYISAQMPDGTVAGGNQRGNRSIDFTTIRSTASFVASGNNSLLIPLGESGSRVTGVGSVALGDSTDVSGQQSYAFAFASNVSGNQSVYIGAFGTVSAPQCYGVGYGLNISSPAGGGYGLGAFSEVTGSYAGVLGLHAKAYLFGQLVHGGTFRFAANGDCQHSWMMASRATADATPANLFLDGSSARLVVPANSAGRCSIRLVGRSNTAGAEWATGDRIVSWWRGVSVGTVVISAIDTIGTDRGSNAGAWPAGWAFAITADVANGAIDIQVTGAAATNIRWGVSISDFTEVTFA